MNTLLLPTVPSHAVPPHYQTRLGCPAIRGLLTDFQVVAKKKRLLCIDDDPKELFLRAAILQSHGYEVVAAKSGMTGLRLMKESVFDGVLLDYCMPEMDGFAVACEARRLAIKVPILIVSGHDVADLPPHLFDLIDGYLKKGSPLADLLTLIRHLTVGS